ncbi:Hin recombinase [Asaia siamensis]
MANCQAQRLAQAAMGKPEPSVAELRAEMGVARYTLDRHVTPKGEIRPDGEKLPARKK